MWKTPEETKKGLECCYSAVEPIMRCEQCPYYGSVVCKMHLHTDALAFIQQLQAENAQQARCIENMTDKLNAMNDEVAKLQAERDAAVADLMVIQECSTCKYDPDDPMEDRPNVCYECCTTKCNYEWRGVQKED